MKGLAFAYTVIAASLCAGASAQQLYFSPYAGYHFPAASETQLLVTSSASSSGTHQEIVKLSLGKGIVAGITPGIMINDHIGLEVGVHYLSGSETQSTHEDASSGTSSVESYEGSMMRLIPGVMITTGEGRFKPYGKAGIIIGVMPSAGYSLTTVNNSYVPAITEEQVWEIEGTAPFGFNFAMGSIIQLGDHFSVFGEVNMIGQSWPMKKMTMTRYTVNGNDQLATLSTSQTQVLFEKEYTEPYTFDPNSPSRMPRMTLPFSSIGINAGIRLIVGRTENESK